MGARQRPLRQSPNRSRRLRKKLRTGEFAELGFEMEFEIREDVERRAREDFLLEELPAAARQHGLRVGRQIFPSHFQQVFVRLDGGRSVTEAQREDFLEWIRSRSDVRGAKAGPIVDMNTLDPGYVAPQSY